MMHASTRFARTESDRFTKAQIALVAICLSVAILDGFDAQLIAYAAPSIVAEFGFGPAAFGVVFSASLLGMVVGSVIFGLLADKIGRRLILVIATAFFGLTTLLIPLVADSIPTFLVIRFIAGIGLGGVAPSFIALIAENVPPKARSLAVMISVGSVSLGAFVAGLVSRWMIPELGWRSVFVVGGLLPLVLALIAFFGLRGTKDRPRPERAPEAPRPSSLSLVQQGRAVSTVILWIVFFANLLAMFSLLNWLPTLLLSSGLSPEAAILASSLFAGGGFLGGIVMGIVIDRTGKAHVTLLVGYAVGLVGLAMVVWSGSTTALMVGVALAGAGIVGGQSGLTVLAVKLYPPEIRGTGIGWAYAFGRFGSIVGPIVSGVLVAAGLGATAIIGFSAVPAALAAVGVVVLAFIGRRMGQGSHE